MPEELDYCPHKGPLPYLSGLSLVFDLLFVLLAIGILLETNQLKAVIRRPHEFLTYITINRVIDLPWLALPCLAAISLTLAVAARWFERETITRRLSLPMSFVICAFAVYAWLGW